MMPIPEPVRYEVAQSSDAEGIVRLIATAFSRFEPLARAVDISVGEMEEFLQPLMPVAIAQGLSVVARRSGSSALAGVLLSDDLALPLPVDPSRISPRFSPIIALLERLEEYYRGGSSVAPGRCLHMFMLAVDERLKGYGIGQGLVVASIDNGSRKGFHAVVAETTAGASQHIFRGLGFAERFHIAYRDFVHEGEAVFGSIQDPPSAILMDKALSE